MTQKVRFGWWCPEEYAVGIRLTLHDDSELIEGLPERFFFRGLVTVLTEHAHGRTTYAILLTDVPSPVLTEAMRSLLGQRLFDTCFRDGEFAYTEDDEGFNKLPEPTEDDFQHMLRAIREDLQAQRA